MFWVILVFIWVVCGVLTFGMALADFQAMSVGYPELRQQQYREDAAMALLFSIFGPIGLFVGFCCSGFAEHGLMYRRKRNDNTN